MADISHWFTRRRGIAVAICRVRQLSRRHDLAAGGAAFHRQRRLARDLYRHRRVLRRHHAAAGAGAAAAAIEQPPCRRRQRRGGAPTAELPLSPTALQVLLCIAGLACCVAMSMPQVHIVAYCGDLGYGVARGADMLSLMLGFGIVSRIASGFIADRIGGVRDAAARLGAARRGAAALSDVRRPGRRST